MKKAPPKPAEREVPQGAVIGAIAVLVLILLFVVYRVFFPDAMAGKVKPPAQQMQMMTSPRMHGARMPAPQPPP